MDFVNSNTHLKEKIKLLPKSELEKLVLKAAVKHKEFNVYLCLNYLDKEQTENELYDEVVLDLNKLMRKNYKGFSRALQLSNMLTACNKRINEFSKISKNRKAELDLLLILLETPFKYEAANLLGSCFTAYDHKVALILKKAITLVNSKLHPDFKIEYTEKINLYLVALHTASKHNDFVYNMPQQI